MWLTSNTPTFVADGDVLLADARVLDRHLPPGERHELRPRRGMPIVQRSPLQRLGAGGHRGRTLAALSARFSGYIAVAMRAGMRGLVGALVVAATAVCGRACGGGGDV